MESVRKFVSIPKFKLTNLAGILSILLNPKLLDIYPKIESNYSEIADTITVLCSICVFNNGHLPMSIPPWPSSRSSPLVQICHGTPGLLVLLASAGRNETFTSRFWTSNWLKAIFMGSERIWEQGLLSKGGSLCHGIAGNALSLLMLHKVFQYNQNLSTTNQMELHSYISKEQSTESIITGDYFLSRALALLLECHKTRPFVLPQDGQRSYRLPDNPYSLFEGLAGVVSAWTEATIIIQLRLIHERLKSSETDDIHSNAEFKDMWNTSWGFPCLADDALPI
jgi:Lanthionine synthetase C-like protein